MEGGFGPGPQFLGGSLVVLKKSSTHNRSRNTNITACSYNNRRDAARTTNENEIGHLTFDIWCWLLLLLSTFKQPVGN